MKLDEAIAQSAEELRQTVERHTSLLAASRGQHAPIAPDVCVSMSCPYRRLLRETLVDTIAVLDDTRKSFKSRQLGALRQKLIAALARHT